MTVGPSPKGGAGAGSPPPLKYAPGIYLTLIINKHFNFRCFTALAYTTLDRRCALFLYNNVMQRIHEAIVGGTGCRNRLRRQLRRQSPRVIRLLMQVLQ